MALAMGDSNGKARLRWSYKWASVLLCAANVVVGLFILHAALSPVCLHSSSSSSLRSRSSDDSASLHAAVSKEELERIKDSNRLRHELLPTTLIDRLEEIRQETEAEINKTETEKRAKQKLASELTEHLLGLEHVNDENAEDISVSDDGLNLSLNELGVDTEDDTIPGRAMPPECHAEAHTDYGGAAVRWGLSHHVASAADCCQACLEQATNSTGKETKKCNIWVYCPSEGGCYSPDKYKHENHECWLKQADEPMLNFKGRFSQEYRRHHPTAPSVVQWVSGVTS